MNARIQLFAVSALLITIAASVGAQNNPPAQAPINSAVGAVADTGAKTCDGVKCVISAVQDAKNSKDPKKMKAALELAEQQLTGVQTSMTKTTKIAQRLHDHMDKIEAQRAKVKQEQANLDALFYPTDSFIIE